MGRLDGQPNYWGRVEANGDRDEESSGPGWESNWVSAGKYTVTVPFDEDSGEEKINLKDDYRLVKLHPDPRDTGWTITETRDDNVMTVTVKNGQAPADHAFKFDLERKDPTEPAPVRKKLVGAKKKTAIKARKKGFTKKTSKKGGGY